VERATSACSPTRLRLSRRNDPDTESPMRTCRAFLHQRHYYVAMRTQLGSAVLAISVGAIVWAITTSLGLLETPWSIMVAVLIGLLVGTVGYVILRRREPAHRRVASGIRAKRNVTVEDVQTSSSMMGRASSDVASDIHSGGDVNVRRVRDEQS